MTSWKANKYYSDGINRRNTFDIKRTTYGMSERGYIFGKIFAFHENFTISFYHMYMTQNRNIYIMYYNLP